MTSTARRLLRALGLSGSGVIAVVCLAVIGAIAFVAGPGSSPARQVLPQPTLSALDPAAAVAPAAAAAKPGDLCAGAHAGSRHAGSNGVVCEQQGALGARTYRNPDGTKVGEHNVLPEAWVAVDCVVNGPSPSGVSPSGPWYRIRSAPWNDEYYALAGTFWNTDVPGEPPYRHIVDPAVRPC